jgi:integrase
MRGNITRRGKSYRIKFDLDRGPDGKRQVRTITVTGSKKQAEAKLAELLNDQAKGVLPDASKLTVEAYLWQWLDGKHGLSRVTVESYSKIIAKGICPTLGKIALQRLRPIEIKSWLSTATTKGSRTGGALSTRTVRHFYRVLRAALADACRLDLLTRNPADAVKPPKLDAAEVEILTAAEISALIDALEGSRLRPIVSLALATGARRSELPAVRWCDVSAGAVRIERSLEQVRGKIAFKCPKTRAGRRSISLPASSLRMLDQHRKEQLQLRMKLGMGKPDADALVLCNPDGSPTLPRRQSKPAKGQIPRLAPQ